MENLNQNKLYGSFSHRNSVVKRSYSFHRINMPTKMNKRMIKYYGNVHRALDDVSNVEKEDKFVFYPLGPFCTCWDFMMTFTLIIFCFYLPFYIAFINDFSYTTIIFDIIFSLDMLYNFNTGYFSKEHKKVIMDRKAIALKYLKSWFIIDILSILPIERILVFHYLEISIVHGFKIIKIISLIKLVRVSKIWKRIDEFCQIMNIDSNVVDMFSLIVWVTLVLHMSACFEYAVPFFSDQLVPSHTGPMADSIINESLFGKYSLALHASVSQVLGCGYGVNPIASFQAGITVFFVILIGQSSCVLLTCSMIVFITNNSKSADRYDLKVQNLIEYMSFKHLPADLRLRILQYLDKRHKGYDYGELELLSDLPHNLKKKISLYVNMHILSYIKPSTNVPKWFLMEVIDLINIKYFLADQTIFEYNPQIIHSQISNQIVFLIDGQMNLTDGQNNLLINYKDTGMINTMKTIEKINDSFKIISAVDTTLFILEYKDIDRLSTTCPQTFMFMDRINW